MKGSSYLLFVENLTDQLVPQRKNNHQTGLIKRWAKTTKFLLYVHCLMVCLITMTKHIHIIRSANFQEDDINIFFVVDQTNHQTVIYCHSHVDVVMWWHYIINMTVLLNTMNIIYNYLTQKIVESTIRIWYSLWVSQKNQTSLIQPIRLNQALGWSSRRRTFFKIKSTHN